MVTNLPPTKRHAMIICALMKLLIYTHFFPFIHPAPTRTRWVVAHLAIVHRTSCEVTSSTLLGAETSDRRRSFRQCSNIVPTLCNYEGTCHMQSSTEHSAYRRKTIMIAFLLQSPPVRFPHLQRHKRTSCSFVGRYLGANIEGPKTWSGTRRYPLPQRHDGAAKHKWVVKVCMDMIITSA